MPKEKVSRVLLSLLLISLLAFAFAIEVIEANPETGITQSLSFAHEASLSCGRKENNELSRIVEHRITALELEKLKMKIGVLEKGRDYNQLVNGYGTGLRPSTEEEWTEIMDEAYIVERIFLDEGIQLPSSVDHTTKPWFPPIGNQDGEGSCTAWAVGYYMKTFQEAKDHGWDLSGAVWEGGDLGEPTPEYQDKIISPDFIYHLINSGVDEGSNPYLAINLVCSVGACSWEKMPYDPDDHSSWPSEEAWREAYYYRGEGGSDMLIDTDVDVASLKNWIASDHLAFITVDASLYSDMTSQDIWTLDNYVTTGTNHANTIVGYNDTIEYTEEGVTRYGAFKIANSWGEGGWENIPDGCYWISYEVMKQCIGYCRFYRDKVDYNPGLVASFKIDHSKRGECNITVGIGDEASPDVVKSFTAYIRGGDYSFCPNNIIFDVTEFMDTVSSVYGQTFFLKIYDGDTSTIGTIQRFAIEYGSYSYESDEPPVGTVNDDYVNVHVTIPVPPQHANSFYPNPDLTFAALLAGKIDFMRWPLTYEQYLEACATPDLQLAGYSENGMMEFDLNNNYTVPSVPGVRNPMHDVSFRRAIAFASNKAFYVYTIIKGFAEIIDCPLCAPQKGYGNECCTLYYPYTYDTDAANALLDTAGFDDWDGDGWRNYPLDWDGVEGATGVRDEPNLCSIDVCIRSDHAHRNAAGTLLATTMQDVLHIPTFFHYGTGDGLFPIVMDDMNYHIYTGGWNLGRYPTYLYGLFNYDNYFSGGSNYVTGVDKNGNPNYPDLDDATHDVFYAPNMAAFTAAVKRACGLHTCKYCVNIPLWSYASWWAYSRYLVGVVNMKGYGLENTYTFLNAYKVDNPATPVDESQDPIRIGTVYAPKDLNILYSSQYQDYAVLDRVFTSLMSVNPYILSVDQPWVAQDWEETEWWDEQDQEHKTKVTYWIRKDVWWHAPETGEPVWQFTAHDVEFSIWYIQAFSDGVHWNSVKNVHHTSLMDDFTIEVYFDVLNIWACESVGLEMPLLPKLQYLPLLCEEEYCEFEVTEPRVPSDKDILCPPCGSIIQITGVTKMPEDIPLIEGVDYEVFGTGAPGYCHNEIHWLRPLDPGEWVVFCYWTPDPLVPPKGYYLGSLPWQQTFYSLGPYYPVSITPGVGGSAIFNCNPTFFLETPPLGEVDWMWYWSGTTKPRSGYYQVNIYDAVMLLKAYCTRGDGVPPPNWEPGADIDPYDLCHIGLYDAVMLLTNYGRKFGIPRDP